MVLTRADWPLDRLEEALLVCDALSAHIPEGADAARPTFSLQADDSHAELGISGLAAQDAERLLGDRLPLVGNVLEQLAESVALEPEPDGSGTRLTIALRT